jgi:hypothetical protein
MSKQSSIERLRAAFPGVKVLLLDDTDHHFVSGLGVEWQGKRNAYALKEDTPENWDSAADKLAAWMTKRGKEP